MTPAGHAATPLAKKLGIVANSRVVVKGAPDDYRSWLEPLPAGVVFDAAVSPATDVVHVFVDRRERLADELGLLWPAIRRDAVVWVSWPKKASKVPTDLTDQVVRERALAVGFVDVKVCAVSDVWSGLKLVVRKSLR